MVHDWLSPKLAAAWMKNWCANWRWTNHGGSGIGMSMLLSVFLSSLQCALKMYQKWCGWLMVVFPMVQLHLYPDQNRCPLLSKIWCISIQKSGASLFKNPIIPPSKIWSSFPTKIWCILSKIWSSFSSKKLQHDQNSSVPRESAKNPSFHTCSHLATVGILQYVDCPDLSHACWPLTILAWWYLPSFLYRILSKSLYLVMIFSPWWLQVSCKN